MRRPARALIGMLMLSVLAGTASPALAQFGQVSTRSSRNLQDRQRSRDNTVTYSKVYDSFIGRDYALTERLASQLQGTRASESEKADALYLQAMSYFKLGRLEDARLTLRRLETLSVDKNVKAAASASLADSYYYEGDLVRAKQGYRATETAYPDSDQSAYLSGRLAELGDTVGMRSLEATGMYTVQVGSFLKHKNASELVSKLQSQELSAHLEKKPDDRMYRVRVGNFTTRQDAESMASKLRRMGYPTKIYP